MVRLTAAPDFEYSLMYLESYAIIIIYNISPIGNSAFTVNEACACFMFVGWCWDWKIGLPHLHISLEGKVVQLNIVNRLGLQKIKTTETTDPITGPISKLPRVAIGGHWLVNSK